MDERFILNEIPLGEIPRKSKSSETVVAVIEKLKQCGYEITVPRKISGYLTRRCTAKISEYSGNYGNGYKIEMPSFDSTGYHYIIYATTPKTASK